MVTLQLQAHWHANSWAKGVRWQGEWVNACVICSILRGAGKQEGFWGLSAGLH